MMRATSFRQSNGGYFALAAIVVFTGCQAVQTNRVVDRLQPSNQRDWSPEFSLLPEAEFSDDQIQIKNVRNINYLTDDNYVVRYSDRSIRLSDIQSVDFIVTPFNNAPALAHTMLSFGMRDGNYLGVSVEIRTERGESYSPLLGISNQFEITYVIADERDLIRVRTHHRNADVYIYPSVATSEQSQKLFVDIMRRINQLKTQPEFYNTLRNNCTTNLVEHVNNLEPRRIAFNWRVLLPGFSAKYAYDTGLIDNRIPFDDLTAIAHVNDAVDRFYYDPDFSRKIRGNRNRIKRLANRQTEFSATENVKVR